MRGILMMMEEKSHAQQPGSESQDKQTDPKGATPERAKLSEAERIDSLRERLYARGTAPVKTERHSLVGTKPHRVEEVKTPRALHSEALRGNSSRDHREAGTVYRDPRTLTGIKKPSEVPPELGFMPQKNKRKYRFIVVLGGILFFILALLLSSIFLFTGSSPISNENITMAISGPFAAGGGEELSFQIAVANNNSVPLESATLIISYPPGTQSATEQGKEVFSERKQLNNIETGEVVNVPGSVIVFGEENEEKVINVSIEYRVRGSNATFYKEAEPLRFKISSSPVVLSVDTVRSISSGQEATIDLTVTSNSPTELTGILVKAAYPFGFDYSSSKPETYAGQDTWLIETLKPEEEKTITIQGIVVGKQDEERVFTFSVGVPNQNDRFNLASIYTMVTREIALEDPFFGVDVKVNGETKNEVAIAYGREATVEVGFVNTLDDTIYDGVVEVKFGGSALDAVNIVTDNGFYDSSKDILTWNFVDLNILEEIEPGSERRLSFEIRPKNNVGRTPEVTMEVTVRGQRVFENSVPQELVSTASRVVRISSDVELASSALYSEGPFTNTGPTPPVAEKVTQYTLLLSVDNEINDITGVAVTAILPPYMTWLDLVTPGDNVSYNSVTRTITWSIGDMSADEHEEVWMQVSFLPSKSQIDTSPTILETQRLTATDRFTGALLRADSSALTTRLLDDPDLDNRDGRVRED